MYGICTIVFSAVKLFRAEGRIICIVSGVLLGVNMQNITQINTEHKHICNERLFFIQ